MFPLFEIQFALKLRRKSIVFLWVEVSILLDVIISLMPFLVKLLLPKKPLIMISQPIPRFAALASVLRPIPIYLDLKKDY